MRCSECNRMVAQEAADVEVSDEKYEEETLQATVQIAQVCAECGNVLKEYTFDVDQAVDDFHKEGYKEEHVVEVDVNAENDDKTEGTGRGAKKFYGAKVIFGLTCSCGETTQVDWEDYIQASSMDEA